MVRLAQLDDGTWELARNGERYPIRGAGGPDRYESLAGLGANSVRTWGISQLEPRDAEGRNLLDRAQAQWLSVAVGIWVQQPRRGFDYSDEKKVAQQRDEIRAHVRRFRDHPSLLVWVLGNEVEISRPAEEYPRIFAELNELARIVKEEDPNHPVMTVIAGTNPAKLQAILENYPELDILGVNAYKSAPQIPQKLKAAGWLKPYVLTEFGPHGPWEMPKTAWGAPVEPSTLAKMKSYKTAYQANVLDHAAQCLGSYAFIWGSKQEATSSWFGLLLPESGEKTPAVDVLSHLWTGSWPANRSPVITAVSSGLDQETLNPGEERKIMITATDEDGDEMKSEAWVMEEAKAPSVGGDKEKVPGRVAECLLPAGDLEYEFRAPRKAGAYRLFLKVTDGQGGGAIESQPFEVR